MGRFHQLTGDLIGVFSLSVGGPLRLLFEPDHDPVPMLPDGGINRARVTRIIILGIRDYHE